MKNSGVWGNEKLGVFNSIEFEMFNLHLMLILI